MDGRRNKAMRNKGTHLRYALQGTVAFCAVLGFGQAHAQQAPAPQQPNASSPDSEEVVVHGYRESVRSAIDTKRRSDSMIDVIRADDMASFPDANLSEAIQRIPGVSIN